MLLANLYQQLECIMHRLLYAYYLIYTLANAKKYLFRMDPSCRGPRAQYHSTSQWRWQANAILIPLKRDFLNLNLSDWFCSLKLSRQDSQRT